ncbi:MAG: thermonuclease family protein [Sphingobium sp.]
MAFIAAAGITHVLMNGGEANLVGAGALLVERASADKASAAATVSTASEPSYSCFGPTVVDGDTIRCAGKRVRLSSIDAPEMPDHCRPGRRCTPGDPFASKANLQSLTRSRRVTCREVDIDHYGRSVAFCSVGGKDLSCAQVQGGFAVRRYGSLRC